ncbi:2-hydroxychromene-2-carboxylate isomerase [Bordetella genomosp. 13]|uniref:2-hydroxychromene-2-carboxylate isomerase n=1 Tax=Bordetella genomosp. 13 TaxID=463040 RepID=UPI0011A28769|nr:2-hydroxychromene-2-carboxylate isomerase [Bordetella genomosp. 13]
MSARAIEYYFWMNSDWAYLGADRLLALSRHHGVPIRYLPVDLPAVYARTGGVLLGRRAPERQAYRVTELARWCRKLGIHVNPRPAYMCPNADQASRIAIAALARGLDAHGLHKAVLKAQWCDERDISDPQTLAAILVEEGLDAGALMAHADEPGVEAEYRRNTDQAVARGVFGSPSYVYEGELFWGQDRLEMLEEAIVASRRPVRPGPG